MRLLCSALLAQLPCHPSHQARHCQMMHDVIPSTMCNKCKLACIVMCMLLCLCKCAAAASGSEKYVESTGASRALCDFVPTEHQGAAQLHEQSSTQRGPTLSEDAIARTRSRPSVWIGEKSK